MGGGGGGGRPTEPQHRGPAPHFKQVAPAHELQNEHEALVVYEHVQEPHHVCVGHFLGVPAGRRELAYTNQSGAPARTPAG